MDPRLARRAVVVVELVELDPTISHEQRGVRLCFVVNDPDVIGDQHFRADRPVATHRQTEESSVNWHGKR